MNIYFFVCRCELAVIVLVFENDGIEIDITLSDVNSKSVCGLDLTTNYLQARLWLAWSVTLINLTRANTRIEIAIWISADNLIKEYRARTYVRT